MATLIPVTQQWFDNNGDPLALGKIYFYEAGTTTPKDTYTTQAGDTENANPVILDASGRASIWGTGSYKEVVKTSADVLISTKDNVTLGADINDGDITNAMLADMAANTVKVRAASTSGVPSDVALTANQFVGRSRAGNVGAKSGMYGTVFDAGTKSSGTYTPDPESGNLQKAVNGGAHTLAPPAFDTTMVIQYTNNASAGAVTTSGFTKVDGSFTTTNGHDFLCYIARVNSFTHLNIVAMQ